MSTQGGGYMPGGDAGAKGGDRGGRSKHTGLVTVNIAQLRALTITEQNCVVVHKRAFGSVSLVGRVVAVESYETRVRYVIVDNSGGEPLTINMWNSEPLTLPTISVGDWIRCFGSCRDQGEDGMSLVAFKVEKVETANELLQMWIERGLANAVLSKRKQNIAEGLHSTTGFPSSTTGGTLPSQRPATSQYGGAAASFADAGGITGMNANQNIVLKAISKDDSESGKSLEQLCSELRMDKGKLKDIVDFLSSEGHIYTTVDENHFKATDA